MQKTLNYKDALRKMRIVANMWRKRDITLKGRVVIANSLVIPIMSYVASVLPCPSDVMKEARNIVETLVWCGKKAKVARGYVTQKTKEGGLGLKDIELMIKTNRI